MTTLKDGQEFAFKSHSGTYLATCALCDRCGVTMGINVCLVSGKLPEGFPCVYQDVSEPSGMSDNGSELYCNACDTQ